MSDFSSQVSEFLDGDFPEAPAAVRLAAGAAAGSVFAVFSVLLALMWLVGGPEVTRRGVRLHVGYATFLYPLGAMTTGALWCFLAPYGRSRVGSAVAGMVAGLAWAAAIAWCIDRGYARWTRTHTLTAATMAVALGGPLGWSAHRIVARRRPAPRRAG